MSRTGRGAVSAPLWKDETLLYFGGGVGPKTSGVSSQNFLTFVCFPAFLSEIRVTAAVKSFYHEHFASEHFAFSLGIQCAKSLMVLMYSGVWFV